MVHYYEFEKNGIYDRDIFFLFHKIQTELKIVILDQN